VLIENTLYNYELGNKYVRLAFLILILLISGCGDLSIGRDIALEEKVLQITKDSEVEVVKMMNLSVAITIFGDEAFRLSDKDRNVLAHEIGNVILHNSSTTESIILIFIKEGHNTMTASYTWENADGQLKPLKSES